jgi:hypothetical protein
MIRWRRIAVSSSVQSGRMFDARVFDAEVFDPEVFDPEPFTGAFTCAPSSAEGVLNSAERGGYQGALAPRIAVATPLDLEKVYVVTRSASGRPSRRCDPLADLGADNSMSPPPWLTRLQANVFGLDRVSSDFAVVAVNLLDDGGPV